MQIRMTWTWLLRPTIHHLLKSMKCKLRFPMVNLPYKHLMEQPLLTPLQMLFAKSTKNKMTLLNISKIAICMWNSQSKLAQLALLSLYTTQKLTKKRIAKLVLSSKFQIKISSWNMLGKKETNFSTLITQIWSLVNLNTLAFRFATINLTKFYQVLGLKTLREMVLTFSDLLRASTSQVYIQNHQNSKFLCAMLCKCFHLSLPVRLLQNLRIRFREMQSLRYQFHQTLMLYNLM